MDLTPVYQAAAGVVAIALPSVALMLWRRGVQIAEAKLHFTLSQADESAVESAIGVGTGLLRAKLATGAMDLKDVHLGNQHIDDIATATTNMIYAGVTSTGVTKEEVAQRLVGALGHALGDDDTVQTIATTPPVATAATSNATITAQAQTIAAQSQTIAAQITPDAATRSNNLQRIQTANANS